MMHVLLFVPSGQMLKQNSIPQYMHTFNLDIYECNVLSTKRLKPSAHLYSTVLQKIFMQHFCIKV